MNTAPIFQNLGRSFKVKIVVFKMPKFLAGITRALLGMKKTA